MKKKTLSIQNKINNIPECPGVYFFKDFKDKILYIGKANNLKKRIANHSKCPSYCDKFCIPQIKKVSYRKTQSQTEALILESDLIKQYKPKYNIMLRDDKQYFYVVFSRDKLPILSTTHQPKGLGIGNCLPAEALAQVGKLEIPPSRVIGPFTDGGALKTVLRYLRKAFPYYTKNHSARSGQAHRKLPCQYCHIGLCPGPNPDIQEYKKNITKLRAVLRGQKPRVLSSLKKEMGQASKNLEYDKAAKIRDQIRALENIFQHKTYDSYETYKSNRLFGAKLRTIEAYDISNIQGKEPVASMVRLENGKPNKAKYRKFKIRLPEKPNDFAMMEEVIHRRLTHVEWPYPDLFLIDGGVGQLNAALKELSKRGLRNAAGLAKKSNELYIPGRKNPILQSSLPMGIKHLLMYARDEAHRFAVSYHRKLHRKKFARYNNNDDD